MNNRQLISPPGRRPRLKYQANRRCNITDISYAMSARIETEPTRILVFQQWGKLDAADAPFRRSPLEVKVAHRPASRSVSYAPSAMGIPAVAISLARGRDAARAADSGAVSETGEKRKEPACRVPLLNRNRKPGQPCENQVHDVRANDSLWSVRACRQNISNPGPSSSHASLARCCGEPTGGQLSRHKWLPEAARPPDLCIVMAGASV